MRFKMDFSKLPKCGAKPKARSLRTHPCRHVALENGRCYYHNGRKPKHGNYTKKTKAERIERRYMIDVMKQSLTSLHKVIHEKK
jgi:hypothetical protein